MNISLFKKGATAFTIIALIVIWSLAAWSLGLKDFEAPEMVIFLGRFHPLVLHMPVGFMALALFLDIGHLLPKTLRKSLPKTTWLHGLTVATATLTVIHGILLFAGGGYEGSELAERHLIGGCAFLTIIAVVFLLNLWLDHKQKMRLLGAPMTLVAMAALSISAHDGASLTHGENYLSQYAPEALKPLLEPGYEKPVVVAEEDIIPIAEQNVYTGTIQPIFDRTCVECHKESKRKGKLRMDSFEQIAKGGSTGPMYVANNIEESLFLQRIHLPTDDDEHMPPEGKKQPTQEEITVLSWWVSIGAPSEGSLASHQPSAEILASINKALGAEEVIVEAKEEEVVQSHTREELTSMINEFNAHNPGHLNHVSLKDNFVIYTTFSDPSQVDNGVLEKLYPFGSYLTEINLNRTKVTTSGVAKLLSQTPNLQKLSLNDCRISDKLVEAISPLTKLEVISLYGTKITDKALMSLAPLPSLKKLYVSNTQATIKGKERALDSIQRLDLILSESAYTPKQEAVKAPEKPTVKKQVTPAKPAPKNLALGKTVKASSEYGAEFPAAAITDGEGHDRMIKDDVHSFWLLPNGKTGFITIDLGKTETISRIVLQNTKNRDFNDRASKSFRIQVSEDHTTFTQVSAGELKRITTNIPGAYPNEEFKFPPAKARYVRVLIDSMFGSGGGLNEVSIYQN